MNRSFTADKSGPVALSLRASTARIRVTVDPATDRARATVTTPATDGPAAEAVQRTIARTLPDWFEVTVPDIPQDHPGTTVPGLPGMRFGRMSGVVGHASTTVIVNGRVVSSVVNGADEQITADVVLPAGSSALVRTVSGDIETTGYLLALGVETTSGAVTARTVRNLAVNGTSGAVYVDRVDGGAVHVHTVSGGIALAGYGGSSADLSSVSGSIGLWGLPAATGVVTASTVSGLVTALNAGHLDVRASSVSGTTRVS